MSAVPGSRASGLRRNGASSRATSSRGSGGHEALELDARGTSERDGHAPPPRHQLLGLGTSIGARGSSRRAWPSSAACGTPTRGRGGPGFSAGSNARWQPELAPGALRGDRELAEIGSAHWRQAKLLPLADLSLRPGRPEDAETRAVEGLRLSVRADRSPVHLSALASRRCHAQGDVPTCRTPLGGNRGGGARGPLGHWDQRARAYAAAIVDAGSRVRAWHAQQVTQVVARRGC